jgi:hypothetical protein
MEQYQYDVAYSWRILGKKYSSMKSMGGRRTLERILP